MRSLFPLGCAFLFLGSVGITTSGCEDRSASSTAGSAPSATASPASSASSEGELGPLEPTGIDDCDAYFSAAKACFSKADADLRKDLRESVKSYENQIDHADSDVAKRAVGVGCSAALDALKEEAACRRGPID